MKTLVTTYTNPDLDGFSCCYAYFEFLSKQGQKVSWCISGVPLNEVDFVVNNLKIKVNHLEGQTINFDQVALVDVSGPAQINKKIDSLNVIEVIDHRPTYNVEDFPKAKFQVESVGACATLITEKFYNENIEISEISATLLYTAIISNTTNFKNATTTQRDIKMADWLKAKINLPDDYIKTFFTYKSKIDIPLIDYLDMDYYGPRKLKENMTGIGQLEIINMEKYVEENLTEMLEFLDKKKKEDKLDIVFLTCIDIEEGYNVIITNNDKTKKILEKVIDYKFHESTLKTNEIFMRKELVYKIDNI